MGRGRAGPEGLSASDYRHRPTAAETVTRVAETGVADADYDAAATEFSAKELADLTYAIGLMNAFNRLGDATTPLRILCIAVILAGVIGLKLVSGN